MRGAIGGHIGAAMSRTNRRMGLGRSHALVVHDGRPLHIAQKKMAKTSAPHQIVLQKSGMFVSRKCYMKVISEDYFNWTQNMTNNSNYINKKINSCRKLL